LNNPTSLLPAVPPQMPQVKPNAFLRWLARCTLRMGGWKVTGTLPDIPRLVFIIAPHSSNWDGLWGMAAKIALGMKVKVLGKASLFWWPLGPLLHKLGVIPLDRSELVSVLDTWSTERSTFWALWPSHRHQQPRVRAFVDFMAEHLLPEPSQCN